MAITSTSFFSDNGLTLIYVRHAIISEKEKRSKRNKIPSILVWILNI